MFVLVLQACMQISCEAERRCFVSKKNWGNFWCSICFFFAQAKMFKFAGGIWMWLSTQTNFVLIFFHFNFLAPGAKLTFWVLVGYLYKLCTQHEKKPFWAPLYALGYLRALSTPLHLSRENIWERSMNFCEKPFKESWQEFISKWRHQEFVSLEGWASTI